MDPIIAFMLAGGIYFGSEFARNLRKRLYYLNTNPVDVRKVLDETLRLEVVLEEVERLQLEWFRDERPAKLPPVISNAATTSRKFRDYDPFYQQFPMVIKFILFLDGQWRRIRNKNSIARLRTQLKSVRYEVYIYLSEIARPSIGHELKASQELYELFSSTLSVPDSSNDNSKLNFSFQGKERRRIQNGFSWNASNLGESNRQPKQDHQRRRRRIYTCGRIENNITSDAYQDGSEDLFDEVGGLRRNTSTLACESRHSSVPGVRFLILGILPCHILTFLDFLTIAGSLAPALWRSISRKDISGGFSIAQYMLAVGVFVVGGILVIHSKTCTCWLTSQQEGGNSSATDDRSLELGLVENPQIRASQAWELPA